MTRSLFRTLGLYAPAWSVCGRITADGYRYRMSAVRA
jgi:hypothetical protein